jgi:electron transport complex, RnfABCDGE type, B subunit
MAFVVIAALGLLLGLGLAVADKKLAVKKDEKLVALEAIMPNANCGGCGYPGCSGYAAAVASGEAPIGLCSPGGSALSRKMSEIMGVEAAPETEKMVAFVFCNGNADVTKTDFDYSGISDCNAASLIQGGPNACKEGCLRLGSCMKVCPAGAIYREADGRIAVDKEKCIGCKKCTAVCPNGVIRMIPYSAEYVIPCNNHEMGAKVKKACQVGCIGCKICQVKFPESGCTVENFLSSIDYSKELKDIEAAAAACPQKCIHKR